MWVAEGCVTGAGLCSGCAKTEVVPPHVGRDPALSLPVGMAESSQHSHHCSWRAQVVSLLTRDVSCRDPATPVFSHQADEIEKILCHKFMRFMMMRAENFFILRRKPVEVRAHDPSVGRTLGSVTVLELVSWLPELSTGLSLGSRVCLYWKRPHKGEGLLLRAERMWCSRTPY